MTVMESAEKRLTIEIDEQLKKDFKAAVSQKGSTLRQTLEALIKDYLGQNQSSITS